MTLGEAIKSARGSRDQTWVALQLGVSQTTISDWERDRNAPRPGKFKQIEEVLGMAPGTLAAIHYGESVAPASIDDAPVEQGQPNPEDAEGIAAFGQLTPENKAAVQTIMTQLLRAQGLDPDEPEVD